MSRHRFFTFEQNNSGGSFVVDENRGIAEVVIIQAKSAALALDKAEEVGLYFDGSGDCDCCGNRWYGLFGDENGDDVPSRYGEPLSNRPNGRTVFVHYAGGGFEERTD